MSNLECLYYFTSSKFEILEIKRTDLSKDAPLGDIFKWLIVTLHSGKILELDFKSMDKSETEEVRQFTEGLLKFNDKEGILNLLGQEMHFLRQNQNEVPINRFDNIKKYLSQSFHHDTNFSFRFLRPSDVRYFKEWILDKEVIRYSLTGFHRLSTEKQITSWFRTTLFDIKNFQLGITEPMSQNLIGYAGIASLNEIDSNGEYFILIGNKSYWGKGIASVVTKEIVKIGFQDLNLHRILLTASSRNLGAIRAYESAGFIHEGKMREAFYRNNEYSDKIFMGILRDEFRD